MSEEICMVHDGLSRSSKIDRRIFRSLHESMKNIPMPNISSILLGKQQRFSFKQVSDRFNCLGKAKLFPFVLETASLIFAFSLVLPVIMMGVGKDIDLERDTSQRQY